MVVCGSRLGCYLKGGNLLDGTCVYDGGSESRNNALMNSIKSMGRVDFLQVCFLANPRDREILLRLRGVSDLSEELVYMIDNGGW